MKKVLISVLLMLGASGVSAEALDCNALANSMDAEPAGYSYACANHVPDWSVRWLEIDGVSDIGFTLDVRGESPRPANTLYTFPLSSFDVQSPIGATQASVFAMDFSPDGETLYAATGAAAATNPSVFGTIDKSTGGFTVIGALAGLTSGDSASGMAIHPRTGVAYFSAAGGTPASSRLYSLNLASGALALIGQITAPTDAAGTIMIDIAINCDGDLYGHNISDDALYSIDLNTGAGTLIGPHGFAANFAQGMDFDNATGILYGFIYTGTGTNRFGSFDLTTGAFTTLVQNNPLGEYEGAIPGQCPASDILFADGFDTVLP